MAKTHPSYTVNTTFSAKNISTAASVYAFTAAASARVNITVKLTNAAGNGDYIVYLTHDWLGAAAAATVLPKTTAAAASGETIIEFMSMALDVANTDVVNVMIDGLAGDTSVNGAIRIVADNPSVFEAGDVTIPTASDNATASAAAILVTPANKLATGAGGVASANVTMQQGVAVAAADANGNVPVVLYGTQGAVTFGQVKILANVLGEGALHVVNSHANGIAQYNESSIGQYNLGVDAGQLNEGPTAGQWNIGSRAVIGVDSQGIRDAMKLAPTAGAPAEGSVDAKLDDILEDTGTTLPAMISDLPTASEIDTELSSTHGGGSWEGGGSGSYAGDGTGYYTDTIDDGTSPLDGVRVQLYTAQNRVGPAYEAYTNALGVFEMWPDPGTYYRWLDYAGVSFAQDVAVVVTEP